MTTALTLPVRRAANERAGRSPGVKSVQAQSLVRDLLAAPADLRRAAMRDLADKEWSYLLAEALRETGSLYGLWYDSPSGFTEDVIGDTLWSKQRNVLDALVDHQKVLVPAGFGVGKTVLAGRAVAWAGAVHPVGNMTIVTIAPKLRQVRYQMWPQIKKAVAKGALPGVTDVMQWRVPNQYGDEVTIAYGFAAAPTDEAAMQGVHGEPYLLLVVEEAGGISQLIGRGTNNLLTGDATMLAIGNPSMSDPQSWFEEAVNEGLDDERPEAVTIRIASIDSPALTGEATPVCRLCVPNRDGHTIAEGVNGKSHLPDMAWLRGTLTSYGAQIESDEDVQEIVRTRKDPEVHPYITAKVLAQFPKDSSTQTIPPTWLEGAATVDDPVGPSFARLCDLGLDGERATFTVKTGSWVRLGVDVAADGGDEFAIYRMVGDVIQQVYVASGAANNDSVAVAERVLEEIDRAQKLAKALRTHAPVRVKIDANGLGWGVAGDLDRWGQTGRHSAQIVPVKVSETPESEDTAAVMRPWRKRDEMWLAGRFMVQPDPSTGFGRIRLRVDTRCQAQLGLPKKEENASGFTVVESKKQMRARGVKSPDRAEAALLAMYEPFPLGRTRRRGLIQ